MKQIQFLLLLVLLTPFAGSAQINLVLNPSFENYSHCPDYDDETKYANHWMSLDTVWSPPDFAHAIYGVPDYCNTCATVRDVSVPVNLRFNRYPRTGNGMMQMQIFYDETDSGFQSRDYLQGHLASTLSASHTYQVAFYTTLEQESFYAINRISAYFDDGTIDTTSTPGRIQNQYIPQVTDSTIISDTLNWTKIQGSFVANGTERLLTIGNFVDINHTNFIAVKDTSLRVYSGGFWAYYLIDDVSVIDCSNIPFAGNDTLIRPGDSAFLGPHEILLPYTWYTMGSTAAFDSGGGVWVHPAHTTTYVLKQDLCGEPKFDTVVVHVWPDTAVDNVPIWQLDKLTMSPNPVVSVLGITGAVGCNVLVYNMLGELVLEKEIPDNYRSQHESMDMAGLLPGLYSVVVVDRVTGYRVTKRVQKE